MTRQPDAPRHVVTSTADAEIVRRRLVRDGWTVREGFALPDPSWDVTAARVVLHGRITDQDALQLAVLAAAAAAEFLSLRTANRRIAEARALFGVRTTREAVLAYLRQRPKQ